MKNTIKHIVFILTIATISILNAEESHPCDKILEQGIRDHYDVQSLHLFEGYLREVLNYSHEELENYVSEKDGSIAVPIPVAEAILKAEAGHSSTEKLITELRTKYSKDLTLEISRQDFESFSSSVINPKILDAWLECLRIHSAGKGKILYQVIGKESEIFGIEVRYLPKQEEDPVEVEVAALNVLGGGQKHVPTLIKAGVKLRRYTSYTQLFKRTDPSAEIIVKLDLVGRSGIEVKIPSLKKVDLVPVGTVVTSVLPWPQFSASVGSNGDYDPIKSSWAPCDSRTIRGSELARLGGGSSAPDLRGAFLRGLNTFATDQPNKVPERQKDPGDRTKAGEFQGHAVGGHSHKFRGGGAVGQTSADKGDDRQGLWHGGDSGQGHQRNTEENPSGETRPLNVSVYYYVKIN